MWATTTNTLLRPPSTSGPASQCCESGRCIGMWLWTWWLHVAPESLHCWLWSYPHSGIFDVGWANSIGLPDFGNPENASNQQRAPGPRPNRAWRKLGSWKRTSEWRFITSTRRLSRWVDERNHGSARNLWCFWCFLFEDICASEICERNLLRQMFERKNMSRGS